MMIGCGFQSFPGASNASTDIMLMEDQWYHIPSHVTKIEASAFNNKEADFIGRRVTKREFMMVLGQMKRLLLRAKYHTDQLEGT